MEYLRTLNQTLAARATGASDVSAASAGTHFMKKPHIKAYIQQVFAAAQADAVVDARRVLKEIERLALVDPLGAFNEFCGMRDIQDIPEDVRRCISGIDVEELWEKRGQQSQQVGVIKKIRFWSKTEGLNMLAKYLRMWVEAGGTGSTPVPVDLSWASAEQLKKLAEGK